MSPNICFSRLARSTFCQRSNRFPPERCAFNPPRFFTNPKSLAEFRASSKLVKATRSRDRCQPSEITGFPPDFNSAGSCYPVWLRSPPENSFIYSASENALPLGDRKKNPAHAEAEDSSKIKDRLEALLYAETLQGTLSPNANPGKGSVGGCSEFDAKSRCEDSASSPDTSSLVLCRFVIPK